ncbi:MAG: protease [Elusimicrobia bacterium RIFCSPLOWO2_02_FULL_39_32]|nr:MAG: protease [Elusimicrobia bacterium GWA2_38_7]OGR78467.1 MAG: protease [Elusimicrobia bacterium RIFCSPHIGHO2_02_FULL_39_36]OGR92226.1 MAG: protease [Elusimicrobia bacterium RIFCSPLOWO2_02_FULL_39_32]OGR99907.1 MAG: protease [Elusimicrobia bacterium RIFCSPLOWO2_12_FULL_39_28]
MKLENKNIVILVEQQYQDLEVWYPYYRLKEEGAKVILAGTGSANTYMGKFGVPAKVDFSIDELKVKNHDAVLIPGGWAPDFLRRYETVIKFVQQMHKAGKLIASICHGGWVLASCGIIEKRTLTSFFAIKDDLINAGAKFVDKEVVVDKNLITSRTPDDLPLFVFEIIKNLSRGK